MNYNLMPVKYFIDVVQTHGFSSAAKRNYVSETAVSTGIKKLETDLGQQLLNRSTKDISLTPVGQEFYRRAVEVINLYSEIWRHPDLNPETLIRLHFFQGLENEAAMIAAKFPVKYQVSFDEETFDQSIQRLINSNYDLLVGFKLAFSANHKIETVPLKKINFDLLFNLTEVEQYDCHIKGLASNSIFYLQNWKSTGIQDIQQANLQIYQNDHWTYRQVEEVDSFAAACLNVNFKGGMTMVPESFVIPQYCKNIYRLAPVHLQKAFTVSLAMSIAAPVEFKKMVKRTATLSYRG